MSNADPGLGEPPYPVGLDLQPQVVNRNRLTTGFRLVLGVPQMIIVGGLSTIGIGYGGLRAAGALAAAAFTMAFISWFAVVFTGR